MVSWGLGHALEPSWTLLRRWLGNQDLSSPWSLLWGPCVSKGSSAGTPGPWLCPPFTQGGAGLVKSRFPSKSLPPREKPLLIVQTLPSREEEALIGDLWPLSSDPCPLTPDAIGVVSAHQSQDPSPGGHYEGRINELFAHQVRQVSPDWEQQKETLTRLGEGGHSHQRLTEGDCWCPARLFFPPPS